MESFRFHRHFEPFTSSRLTFENQGNKSQALCSKSRNLKLFDFTIKKKLKLLEDQTFKAHRASLRLSSHLKVKMIANYQISFRKKHDKIFKAAAIKIQKCFRGYLARKKYADINLKYKKSQVKSKIEDLRQSVDFIFLNSKVIEEAVLKIQRAFRTFKNRQIINSWIRVLKKLRTKKIAKELLRRSFRGFVTKRRLDIAKRDMNINLQIKQLRIDLAMRRIKRFWIEKKLSFEEMMKNVKSYKEKVNEVQEEKIIIVVTADNTDNGKNDKKKELNRQKSIMKKSFHGLPAISTTPVNSNKGSFNFKLHPKRAISHNRFLSKPAVLKKNTEKLPNLFKSTGT